MPKILIVEDYPDLCEFFTLLLQINGFEVDGVLSKEDALKELETYTPEVVLMDVMLGNDSGRDLCKEIKQKYESISVILISANPHRLLDYEECHADGVIEKPFNNQNVLDKIQYLIEAKKWRTR
jgi:DNA-binding response OmpR family regulator